MISSLAFVTVGVGPTLVESFRTVTVTGAELDVYVLSDFLPRDKVPECLGGSVH